MKTADNRTKRNKKICMKIQTKKLEPSLLRTVDVKFTIEITERPKIITFRLQFNLHCINGVFFQNYIKYFDVMSCSS